MERIYNRKNKYNGGNNNWNITMKRNEPFRVNKLQLGSCLIVDLEYIISQI